jgi:hypothetical protein
VAAAVAVCDAERAGTRRDVVFDVRHAGGEQVEPERLIDPHAHVLDADDEWLVVIAIGLFAIHQAQLLAVARRRVQARARARRRAASHVDDDAVVRANQPVSLQVDVGLIAEPPVVVVGLVRRPRRVAAAHHEHGIRHGLGRVSIAAPRVPELDVQVPVAGARDDGVVQLIVGYVRLDRAGHHRAQLERLERGRVGDA